MSDFLGAKPASWPDPVDPPDAGGTWEQSAAKWLFDQVPGEWRDGRNGRQCRQHPIMLTRDARYLIEGQLNGLREADVRRGRCPPGPAPHPDSARRRRDHRRQMGPNGAHQLERSRLAFHPSPCGRSSTGFPASGLESTDLETPRGAMSSVSAADRLIASRRAFMRELRRAGLNDFRRLPDEPLEQQAMLARIDELLMRSDELGPRIVQLPRSGDPVTVEVTINDCLDSLRRALVAAIMRRQMGAAATDLEQAIGELGPTGRSASIQQALGQLDEAKRLAEDEAARGKREAGEAEWLWEERRAELKARMADRRRDRWFTRDSIAALAGALLLLGFAAVLVVMMFQGKQPSDIISNAFLLILGFFFGQGTRGGKSE